MRLAVMQPYIFPYIGYFQLINAIDVFVFYDDVNFIKGGWIHRNRILVNNSDNLFAIPLEKASSFRKINEIMINSKIFEDRKNKFFKTIHQSYSKAPYYNQVFPIIERVFKEGESSNIGDLAAKSVLETSEYLGLEKQWFLSSKSFVELKDKERTERLLQISKSTKCDTYINAIGGKELYTNEDFIREGITLKFIESGKVEYSQYSNKFVPNLSIIDVMMFNSIEQIHSLLNNYILTD